MTNDCAAARPAAAQCGPRLALAPNEIHLWLTFYDEPIEESLLATYRRLLDPAERAQEGRFHFTRDRRRHLLTRALVRTSLSRYLEVAPEAWRFTPSVYGRPELMNREAIEAGVSFNISHTHSLIVLAIAQRRELGVDVENVRARQVSIDIADHYFAPDEVKALHEVPEDRQQERFFEYWTFKESYIKARGMGLSLPLDKFSVHYRDDRSVALHVDPELADDASRWELRQFRPTPEYLVALCSERVAAVPLTVTVRKAIPLLSDESFPATFLRHSE